MLLIISVLLLVAASVDVSAQQSGPLSERESDVYKIYSILLTGPSTSHGPDNNTRYIISDVTAVVGTQTPCVRPPQGGEAEFAEVLADFEARRNTPRKLKRQMTIPKAYDLLTPEQSKEFIQDRSIRPGAVERNPKYDGVVDLFTLSDVWFSRDGKLALTAISTFCGSLCGQHQWNVFEKMPNGDWQQRNWITCFTIA
jgi:hypothetical protein